MKKIIYQALTRLWGDGHMSSWDRKSFEYLKSLGVDYIWYTGIPRHASGEDFVKGNPGSPYAICDWKDVNPYLADNPGRRKTEFRDLVKRTHEAGLKCIIDFIPNHVACNYSGPIVHHDWCDGDWTDTRKNDYSRRETVEAMVDILKYWASKGVDGFRCDMVELVPKEAMTEIISRVKEKYPALIFIAEVYNIDGYWEYLNTVGFDLLYDKSGIYDKLRAITCSNASAKQLTWYWQWLGDMQDRMLNFLENHDEQRLASPWFAGTPQKGYAALSYALLFNKASFMLYFGQEVGEDAAEGHEGRTSIFEWCKPQGIDALHALISEGKEMDEAKTAVLTKYRELMCLASEELFRDGENWDLAYCQPEESGFNQDRHAAFLRFNAKHKALVFCNFSNTVADAEIVVPAEAAGKEFRIEVQVPAWDSSVIFLDSI